MESIIAVTDGTDEWAMEVIPNASTPNHARIEILKRLNIQISDLFASIYLTPDQVIYDLLRGKINVDMNQVTKLFSIFLLINDYVSLKDYLLRLSNEALIHALKLLGKLVNSNSEKLFSIDPIEKVIYEVVAEKLSSDIHFDISYLNTKSRMNIGLKFLHREDFDRYLSTYYKSIM